MFRRFCRPCRCILSRQFQPLVQSSAEMQGRSNVDRARALHIKQPWIILSLQIHSAKSIWTILSSLR